MTETAEAGFSGHNLSCRRGERLVFARLQFRAAAGDVLLLRGPNGSGKSTLLRCMAGLLPPTEGSLTWSGAPVAREPEAHRARLRYLGHQDAVKPALSVLENLLMWTRLQGGDAAAAPTALERLGLASLADLPAQYLSAGQRRRLALARLLAAPAPLWLLDEPTAALDDESTGRLLALVDEHRRTGGIAIMSVHGVIDVAAAELPLDRFAAVEAADDAGAGR